MEVIIRKGVRQLFKKLIKKGSNYEKKNEVVRLETEAFISKIVFGMVHERPKEEFLKILHLPVPITRHWNQLEVRVEQGNKGFPGIHSLILYQWVPVNCFNQLITQARSQDLGFRTSTRGFRTWVSDLNARFQDLDLRTWVSGPRKLSILRSSYLFPVTFLCVHRHGSLRPVITDRLTAH